MSAASTFSPAAKPFFAARARHLSRCVLVGRACCSRRFSSRSSSFLRRFWSTSFCRSSRFASLSASLARRFSSRSSSRAIRLPVPHTGHGKQ